MQYRYLVPYIDEYNHVWQGVRLGDQGDIDRWQNWSCPKQISMHCPVPSMASDDFCKKNECKSSFPLRDMAQKWWHFHLLRIKPASHLIWDAIKRQNDLKLISWKIKSILQTLANPFLTIYYSYLEKLVHKMREMKSLCQKKWTQIVCMNAFACTLEYMCMWVTCSVNLCLYVYVFVCICVWVFVLV